VSPLRCYAIRSKRSDGTVIEALLPSVKNDAGARKEAHKTSLLAAYVECTAGIMDNASGRFLKIARFVRISDNRATEVA
jgi:hypothetical protein